MQGEDRNGEPIRAVSHRVLLHEGALWGAWCEREKVVHEVAVMPSLFVMNSPILTSWGRFTFWRIEREEAAAILMTSAFISAVGHEGTATLLSKMLRVQIPASRIQIKMDVGDRAIVFRLLERLPEGKVLTEDELWHLPCEFGIMERLPDKEPEKLPLCPRCGGETFRHMSGLIMCSDGCGWKEKFHPVRAERGWNW